MSDITVQINGAPFKMSFSLKVFRTLGKVWGLNTLPEVMEKVALIEKIAEGGFDVYDILFEVLFQAIDCNPNNETKISKDEIESLEIDQLIILSSSLSKGMIEAFGTAEPGTEEKKKKAPKK